jgi:hypothetical protein
MFTGFSTGQAGNFDLGLTPQGTVGGKRLRLHSFRPGVHDGSLGLTSTGILGRRRGTL